MRWLSIALAVVLPLVDLAWNLTHLNIGLVDFYGVTLPALGLVQNHAWPATPYFPAGYSLLLIPAGLLGSTLVGGYLLTALGAMLALTGVRELARELGVNEDWTLATIALAWAEPTFRVTSGAPTPDMLMTGFGVWFLWSAVAIWRTSRDDSVEPQWKAALVMAASCFVLPLLRYHAYVLIVPIVLVLLVAGKLRFDVRRKPFEAGSPAYATLVVGAIILAWTTNALPYYLQNHQLMSSSSGLQVRVGLEADSPGFFSSTEELFNRYGAFADFARRRSVISDYGVSAIAFHTVKQLVRFLRRPPVTLSLLLVLVALVRKKLTAEYALLAIWTVLYSLSLGIAYYTPRAALLVVLAGVALCFALLPRIFERKADIALAASCALLLVAYWPTGRFARADFAQRAEFTQKSRQTAAMLTLQGLDPDGYIVSDMRFIRLPNMDNPWQKPYLTLEGSWLDDPAIRSVQVPGYREEDAFSAPASPGPRDDKSSSGPPASADSPGR